MHIATYINGGAGTAAYRLHDAMLTAGVNSYFLSTDALIHGQAKITLLLDKPYYSLAQRAIRKFKRSLAYLLSNLNIQSPFFLNARLQKILKSLQVEVASSPFSDYDLLQHPLVKKADIIHLHWVAGVLDYPSFFKYNSKPIVWTLHDMNPIKGLFHYEGDEIRSQYLSNTLNTITKNIKQQALLQNNKLLAVVSPSLWLHELAEASNMFGKASFHRIPYAIDTKVFSIRDISALKAALKIPTQNTVFLFVSLTVENYRKGFDLLKEAICQLDTSNITLLIIGHSNQIIFPKEIQSIYLGLVYDNELLSKYYSLADAFIIPSREDNLPNVMLESLACGTSIISFNVGGMKHTIVNGFNGLKAEKVDSASLSKTLKMFIETKEIFESEKIRQHVVDNFSQASVANQYIKLYDNLLNA